jgi:hypothetical protein
MMKKAVGLILILCRKAKSERHRAAEAYTAAFTRPERHLRFHLLPG